MLESYMFQLESIIEKDEYNRSNFEEKIRQREQLKLSSEKELDMQYSSTEKKTSVALNLSKKDNKVNSIENRPAWGSNTLKNKKNKIRENLKQEKIIFLFHKKRNYSHFLSIYIYFLYPRFY